MINFAVINLKSTIKNFSKIIIVLLLIIGIVNLSDLIKNNKIKLDYIDIVKACINYKFDEKKEEDNSLEKIIFYQEMPILAAANDIIDNDISETISESSSNSEINSEVDNTVTGVQPEETSEASVVSNENTDLRNVTTEVISENNIAENYNTLYGNVKIKNETSFNLTQDILTPNVEFTNKKDIVIFHTHTCESYTPTEANSYVASRKL